MLVIGTSNLVSIHEDVQSLGDKHDEIMRQMQLAVAGAGLIGRRHIELIQQSPRCRLAAIVEPSPAAQEVAKQADVPLFRTLGELFAASRPDGVVLATPNQLHVEQAFECIGARIPALIEKPVAHTLDEGERLRALADETGVPLLVGHHRAHSPILAKAREIIGEGRIGKVVGVMGSAVFYKPDEYFDAAPWRREAGGGPILINMIHEIGNLRSLCGEIVAVQAFASVTLSNVGCCAKSSTYLAGLPPQQAIEALGAINCWHNNPTGPLTTLAAARLAAMGLQIQDV